jgi:hypothetical protein
MTNFSRRRLAALLTGCLLACVATAATAALASKPQVKVTTGSATHRKGTAAELTAVIAEPPGIATSYYFRWGPTIAYGKQTPIVKVPAVKSKTVEKVKVGQGVSGLQPTIVYHFRVVVLFGEGTVIEGKDRTFTAKAAKPKLELTKLASATVGTPFVLNGVLGGLGNAGRHVTLEASPYPYLESFAPIGMAATTSATGRFAFRVGNLSRNTQFRVVTQDLRQLLSNVITVHAAVKVILHVRTSRSGLVRLYGTVTPAVSHAQVDFQLLRKIRPNKKEETTRYSTQFSTSVKKATRRFSHFSYVARVRRGGRYRAYVRVPAGPLFSGISTHTVVLHAAASTKKKHKG